MHTNSLIMVQQIIATARIGLPPTQEANAHALAAINAAQENLRRSGRSGRSALDLDSTRADASVLAPGHRPHEKMCIAAVQSIAAVSRRAPQDVDEVPS